MEQRSSSSMTGWHGQDLTVLPVANDSNRDSHGQALALAACHSVSSAAKWRVYAIEAALLGLFMVSACVFATLVNHPQSPAFQCIGSPLARRAVIGAAMGLTAVALIYSPWGRRSGAHMNPAMTLGTLRLGWITAADAALYVAAQFVGGAAGVGLMSILFNAWVAHPSVQYVTTVPGSAGLGVAWVAEFTIAAVLMGVVMAVNRSRLKRFTGCAAGVMVALYITFEAPLSGMSMNPARTFGSAVIANWWAGWWIYFTAPVLGMLAAVEVGRLLGGGGACGRLTHSKGCFIKCDCHQHTRNP